MRTINKEYTSNGVCRFAQEILSNLHVAAGYFVCTESNQAMFEYQYSHYMIRV